MNPIIFIVLGIVLVLLAVFLFQRAQSPTETLQQEPENKDSNSELDLAEYDRAILDNDSTGGNKDSTTHVIHTDDGPPELKEHDLPSAGTHSPTKSDSLKTAGEGSGKLQPSTNAK